MNQVIWSPGRKLEEIERDAILFALRFYHWHRGRAAESLGISYRTMTSKVSTFKSMGIDIPDSMWGGDNATEDKRTQSATRT